MFFHPKTLKSENNNPWFKPWFNILLHTQSIVRSTVDSQCLEYLGYITLHFLSIIFPPLFSAFGKNRRWRFHEKSFRKGKEKLTNGQKCTSLAVLRMHLMIEKNDKCHFVGEEIQNWFYRQKPQTLPDYFEVCTTMYFSLFWLFMHA